MDPSESGVSIKTVRNLADQTVKRANEIVNTIEPLIKDSQSEREQAMLAALSQLAQEVRSLGQQMQGATFVLDELYGD